LIIDNKKQFKYLSSMKNKMTFDQWMSLVNQHVESLCGMSASDLPDCSYYAWWEEGKRPASAARIAVKQSME
jgi:hypothetical protein